MNSIVYSNLYCILCLVLLFCVFCFVFCFLFCYFALRPFFGTVVTILPISFQKSHHFPYCKTFPIKCVNLFFLYTESRQSVIQGLNQYASFLARSLEPGNSCHSASTVTTLKIDVPVAMATNSKPFHSSLDQRSLRSALSVPATQPVSQTYRTGCWFRIFCTMLGNSCLAILFFESNQNGLSHTTHATITGCVLTSTS